MFKQKIAAASFVRKSKLIIGLDLTVNMAGIGGSERRAERDRVEREALKIVNATADYAAAYKINRHLTLPLGLYDGVARIIDAIHDLGLTAVMDCKINDIGNTNSQIAQYYYDAGFDAVIANPFVGWEGGLDSVFELARHLDRGVVTLCYMSHPAAHEGYGLRATADPKGKDFEPLYLTFARRARAWGADGVIVGATYPNIIREVKHVLGQDIPIISPGVGAQGASVRDAIDAGATYVIVARAIVNAEDPAAAARDFAEQTK
jgi:orotidine-5'-phosphate decarboxylase